MDRHVLVLQRFFDFRAGVQVRQAMSADVVSCREHTSLQEVACLMWKHDTGLIPVVSDEGKPLGVITDRDIAMTALHRHRALHEIQAHEFTHQGDLVCCQADAVIEDCIRQMETQRVRRVLVLDKEGQLAGVVSVGDVLNCSLKGDSRLDGLKTKLLNRKVIGMLRSVTGRKPDPVMQRQRPALAGKAHRMLGEIFRRSSSLLSIVRRHFQRSGTAAES